jgi:hypothetical protein
MLTTFYTALEAYRVHAATARLARKIGDAKVVGKAAARAGVALREMRMAAKAINAGASGVQS